MRTLLVLMLACALPSVARAAGPEEPRPSTAPDAATATPTPQPSTATTTAPGATVVTAGHDIEEVVPNPPRSRAIILGSVAGGCFLLGGILGGVALARAGEQSGDASHPTLYTQELADHAGEGRSLAIAAYVFFGLGAALAIADVVLWIETLRKPRVIKRSVAAGFGGGLLRAFSSQGVRF